MELNALNFQVYNYPESYREGFRFDKVGKIAEPVICAISLMALGGTIAAVVLSPASALAIAGLVISSLFFAIIIVCKTTSVLYPHLPEKLKKIIDKIDVFFREALVVIVFIFTFPFPATWFDGCRTTNKTVPTLFLHGSHSTSSILHYPISRLQRHVGPIHTLNMGNMFKYRFTDFVVDAAEKIADMVQDNENIEIDLCGYSAGGTVSELLAKHIHNIAIMYEWWDDVDPSYRERINKISEKLSKVTIRKVVTIASNINWLSQYSDTSQNKKPIQYLHFGAPEDFIVYPINVCFDNRKNHRNVILENHGHLTSLFSDDMLDRTIQFLTS